MKIAHIGDIHLGLNYPGPTPASRFNDIVRVMDWCADRIIKEECDMVLVAGDMFKDARVFLDRAWREIIAVAKWIRKLTMAGIEVIMIPGTPSHDAISAYKLLEEMDIPKCQIQMEPGPIHLFDVKKIEHSCGIACLPGMNRAIFAAQEEYRNLPASMLHQIMTETIKRLCQIMLSDLDPLLPRILLSHLSYDLADKGFEDVLMQHEPVLTQEAIQGYDLVLLGHIHRPQQNGKVFYCGSPERLTFNDEAITPGFWIHDMDHSNVTSTFIKTPARSFYTLAWNEVDVLRYLDGNALAAWVIEEAIVRLRYDCPESMAKQINRKELEKTLYDAGAFYVSEIAGTVTESTRSRDQEVTTEMEVVDALQKWCEQPEINIDPDEIPYLLNMAGELLGGATI